MISWINPIVVWMYLIYMAASVIAGPIVIGYWVFKLIKRNEKKKNDDYERRLERY